MITLASLANGETKTITLNATVNPSLANGLPIKNAATVAGLTADSVAAYSTASFTVKEKHWRFTTTRWLLPRNRNNHITLSTNRVR